MSTSLGRKTAPSKSVRAAADTVLEQRKNQRITTPVLKVQGACYRCGQGQHPPSTCKYMYKSYKCNNCGKVGHLAAVCKSKSTKFVVSELREEGDCEMHTLGLFTVSEKSKDDALTVTVEIKDRPVIMEVDTGFVNECHSSRLVS